MLVTAVVVSTGSIGLSFLQEYAVKIKRNKTITPEICNFELF
jgi:hypothetical protein